MSRVPNPLKKGIALFIIGIGRSKSTRCRSCYNCFKQKRLLSELVWFSPRLNPYALVGNNKHPIMIHIISSFMSFQIGRGCHNIKWLFPNMMSFFMPKVRGKTHWLAKLGQPFFRSGFLPSAFTKANYAWRLRGRRHLLYYYRFFSAG